MLVSIQPLQLLVPVLLVGCSSCASSAEAARQDVGARGHNSCATSSACVGEDEEHYIHLIQTSLVLTGDRPPTGRSGDHASNAPAFSSATAPQLLELIQGNDLDRLHEIFGALVDNPVLVNSLATSFQQHLLHNDSKAVAKPKTERNYSKYAKAAANARRNQTTEPNYSRYAKAAANARRNRTREKELIKEREEQIVQDAIQAHIRDQAANTGPFDLLQGQWMMMNLDEGECNPWHFVAVVCAYTLACIVVELTWPTAQGMAEANSNRNDEWDLAKFWFVGCVVLMHSLLVLVRLFGKHNIYEMWTGCWLGIPSVMPGLVFISGVFSQSMSKKSLALTFLGLPCTQLLFDLTLSLETLVTPGFHVFQIGRSGVEWYLECMLGWRLGIAPIFYLAKRHGVPLWLIFALTYMVCYFYWFFWPYDEHQMFSAIAALKTLLPWRLFVLFGPFFALGLLKNVGEWNAFLSNPVTISTSVIIVATYIVLMPTSDGFRTIFDTGCGNQGQCSAVWWPQSLVKVKDLGMHSLMIYTWVFIQRTTMSLATISVCFGMLGPMKRHIPRVASLVTSFGTRTFYSYLLHWLLWAMPASRLGLGRMLSQQHIAEPPWWRYMCFFVTCWIIHCVLSCRLTELLFQWLIKMPLWVVRCFGIRLDGSRDTKQPVAKTAEATSKITAASLLLAAKPV